MGAGVGRPGINGFNISASNPLIASRIITIITIGDPMADSIAKKVLSSSPIDGGLKIR